MSTKVMNTWFAISNKYKKYKGDRFIFFDKGRRVLKAVPRQLGELIEEVEERHPENAPDRTSRG
ncbi:MAG: hypothetical protein HY880_08305 [Deltaproteobacteria bacterium]|nr:hypothetical protein [Deltaproteobacteria bacterium]